MHLNNDLTHLWPQLLDNEGLLLIKKFSQNTYLLLWKFRTTNLTGYLIVIKYIYWLLLQLLIRLQLDLGYLQWFNFDWNLLLNRVALKAAWLLFLLLNLMVWWAWQRMIFNWLFCCIQLFLFDIWLSFFSLLLSFNLHTLFLLPLKWHLAFHGGRTFHTFIIIGLKTTCGRGYRIKLAITHDDLRVWQIRWR